MVCEVDMVHGEGITGKAEPVLHPPRTRVVPIVITANQNLTSWKCRPDRIPTIVLVDEHISTNDNEIVRRHQILPVSNHQFREVRGTVAIGLDVIVVEVRVVNYPFLHDTIIVDPSIEILPRPVKYARGCGPSARNTVSAGTLNTIFSP